MTSELIIFLTLVPFVLMGQDTTDAKKKYEYEFCVRQAATPGKITRNSKIGIADTVLAHLSGRILEEEEGVPFCNVTITNLEDDKVVGTQSNVDGYYEIYLVKDTYKLEITRIGFTTVTLDRVNLGTGEIREINASLGTADGFVTYGITTDEPMTEKQWKKWKDNLTKKYGDKKK